MATPVDPTSAGFLLAESRQQPMHVAGLQLFRKPEGAGPEYVREMYEHALDVEEVAPLFLRHPRRSVASGGQWFWHQDQNFDIEHHVRHSALPQPGRIRELLELCGRLHGTRLAYERPLWEAHIIEGLRDDRVAMYTKMHHALVDGVSSMRLTQSVLSKDPDERDMPPAWASRPAADRAERDTAAADRAFLDLPISAFRTALGITADAAGLPGALVKTLSRGLRNETSTLSLYAPRTIINKKITGARRFAAEDWPVERIRAVGKASGTTINDVVLAMCSGALRRYLIELDALPETTMVAMVPVSLKASEAHTASTEGGNAIGVVMCKLGTDVADPGDRLAAIHASMVDGKEALASMSPAQILAMSAIGMAPAVINPVLRLQGLTRPPFNLVISNVPGPREPHYFNGARLEGIYPLSIPIHGMGLNITCTSYDQQMGFGLTGCRATVPRLQRLLVHLDDELGALEQATGVA